MPLWRYLEAGGKRAAAVWHRRAGKDDVALHWTATQAIQKQANYWHMLPQFNQARRAIWEAVNAHTGKRRIDEAFPQEIRARTNEHDMFIEFVNGSTWRVVGSDNFDALVGAGPLGIVFSEWSLSNPRAWLTLAPILEENGGWSLFIYTPRGRNHGWTLLEMARKTPEWHASVLTAAETPIFQPAQLDRIKAEYEALFPGVGEDMFDQEYHCNFAAAMPGAYYAKLVEKADTEGRVDALPHRADLPVWTGWDLGIGDDTSIWFCQRVGGWLHIIDHYATNGQPASHYVEVLNKKPYTYAGHILPHDADNREWLAGHKRIDVLRSLGLKGIRVLERMPVDDGINAVRLILPTCRFDREKCKSGLESLRQYRREYDDDKRCFKPTPLHDWTSHDADAMRTLACGLRPEAAVPPDIPAYSRGRRERARAGAHGGGSWMSA